MISTQTHTRTKRAGDSLAFVTDKGGYIEGDDAGRTLSDRKIVHQLGGSHPAPRFIKIPLQKREHGIAAAEIDGADPKKGHIKFHQFMHFTQLLLLFYI